MLVLRPQSGTPIYRQIVNQIRRLIESGRLEPGTPLPSVRTLALEHAVNPMTISKAYALLEGEGWLERHPGKPMTVADARARPHTRERREALESQVRELVLAGRQLDLTRKDLHALIEEYWEKNDE